MFILPISEELVDLPAAGTHERRLLVIPAILVPHVGGVAEEGDEDRKQNCQYRARRDAALHGQVLGLGWGLRAQWKA